MLLGAVIFTSLSGRAPTKKITQLLLARDSIQYEYHAYWPNHFVVAGYGICG